MLGTATEPAVTDTANPETQSGSVLPLSFGSNVQTPFGIFPLNTDKANAGENVPDTGGTPDVTIENPSSKTVVTVLVVEPL